MRERELEERKALKERELALQIERENANKSVVHRAKLFGDAMKNTIARMPMDVVELGSYFNDVEQLFINFEVPEDLRAQLLRPHLNEKAKTLVARMDPAQSTNYKAVKEMLLREFKLSPAVYLEKFNNESRKPEETYVLYSARLKSLLEYYLDSRKVDKNYNKLLELLVCDRVKTSLPDGCLRHILSIESNRPDGWLNIHDLADAIDLYFSNRWRDGDRPRAGAVGLPSTTRPGGPHSVGLPRTNNSVASKTLGNSPCNKSNTSINDVSKVSATPGNQKNCFNCGSKFHFARDCPDRDKVAVNSSRPTQRQNAKAYTCVVKQGNATQAGDVTSPLARTKTKRGTFVDACVQASSTDNQSNRSEEGANASTSGEACTTVSLTRSDDVINDFSKLQYINVRVTDDPNSTYKVMSALCDSGAEICVIKADRVRGFNLSQVMNIKLRGIVGSPVSAEVVKLFISCNEGNGSPDDFISIMCAVCAEANDDLILTADVVASLGQRRACMFNVDVLHEGSDDDSDDDNDEADTDGDSQPHRRSEAAKTSGNCDLNQTNGNISTADNVGDMNVADSRRANSEAMRTEQANDETLKGWFSLAKRGKGNFVIHDGILYRNERILGQNFMQLCLPRGRRAEVLTMAHDTFGGHLGARKTQERVRLSFTWPTLASDVKKYCESCEACQKRARTSCWDRVPITPVPRAEAPFTHWFMDCLGPIFNHKVEYNYCLVLVDSATRWPAAFPLRSLTAKHVCEALLKLWMITGVPMVISSDNATNFTSKLNRELLERIGCDPRFNTPGHPQSSGLVERMADTIKNMIQHILQPLKRFAAAWPLHLQQLEKFLQAIRGAGLTLNLKKCNFGRSEVKFCGHLVGSGQRRADPDKVASVQYLKTPETKTQVRQILGFFSWFRDYIPDFATHAKALTDLTAKRIPNKIPWREAQQKAFDKLKTLLCEATEKPLSIVDFNKPFNLFVDASDYAIAGILTQTDDQGKEKPIAFASHKLSDTQKAWATVEKEAYAALWSLQKYRSWVFGAAVTVHSDHNPLTYLTDSAPKSAKLMRWALALQEFNVTFKYKPGKNNVAADCLSRLGPDCCEDPGQRG